jgi:hypothetical protein
VLRVEHVWIEPLDDISGDDVKREGFPKLTTGGFVRMFCESHKGCMPGSLVTRIEFSYVDQPTGAPV